MTATATVPDISIPPIINITGGEKTKTIKIKEFPYEKTLAELLSEFSETYAALAPHVSNCECTDGTNVEVSGEAPNYTFDVTGTGTSKFNVTVDNPLYPSGPASWVIPVTITVTE
jgi:hypothetical protein